MATPSLDDLIDVHSVESDWQHDVMASLETNRLDPKLLYVTPRQSALWREVFLRRSPIHANPEFARIYRDAFARITDHSLPDNVGLIGLGCGTGIKERDLGFCLKSAGREISFTAVDVSRELVVESMRNLSSAGAKLKRSLVSDLSRTESLSAWLKQNGEDAPRVLTFFGLVPNFTPNAVVRLMRAVLRAGDVLLVSAHLAPVSESLDLDAGMRRVLPQYDNSETLAWLNAGLEQWQLDGLVFPPGMSVGEMDGIPAFIAEARWKSSQPFKRWGRSFSPDPSRSLQIFHSLRYTPALFEDLLSKHGFEFERLAITACREEAIWSVRLSP